MQKVHFQCKFGMAHKLFNDGMYENEKWLTWWQKTTKTCCLLNYMANVYATRHIVWQIYTSYHHAHTDHFNYWSICVSLSCEIELTRTRHMKRSALSMHEMGTTGINLHALWIMTAECVFAYMQFTLLQIKYVEKIFLFCSRMQIGSPEWNASK